MGAKIDLTCGHKETKSGAVVVTPQNFSAEPPACDDGALLAIDGEGVLLDGDNFYAAIEHIPKADGFLTPPSKHGTLEAGQSLLTVEGRSVVTSAGRVTVCCEMQPKRPLATAETTGGNSLIVVDSSPVQTGSTPRGGM
jgi:hypothetical protein